MKLSINLLIHQQLRQHREKIPSYATSRLEPTVRSEHLTHDAHPPEPSRDGNHTRKGFRISSRKNRMINMRRAYKVEVAGQETHTTTGTNLRMQEVVADMFQSRTREAVCRMAYKWSFWRKYQQEYRSQLLRKGGYNGA